MTLVASGTISLANIGTEFGKAATHSLSDFYRGGTYVPPLTANASIPTSGTISFSNFYSASVATDMDASYYVESAGVKGGGSTASVAIWTDGTSSGIASPSPIATFSDTWVAYSADPGAWYQVYVSLTSGTTPNAGDSLNTWLDLSTSRSWALSGSSLSCVLSLKIRHKYNTASEETTSVTLVASP